LHARVFVQRRQIEIGRAIAGIWPPRANDQIVPRGSSINAGPGTLAIILAKGTGGCSMMANIAAQNSS
jgi:hypothetical protein